MRVGCRENESPVRCVPSSTMRAVKPLARSLTLAGSSDSPH
jgi:hypothetical protein